MSLMQTVIAALISSALVTLVHAYLLYLESSGHLRLWTTSWLLHTARLGMVALMVAVGRRAGLAVAEQLSALLSGVLLYAGTCAYNSLKVRRWGLWAALPIGVWAVANGLAGPLHPFGCWPVSLYLAYVGVRQGLAMVRAPSPPSVAEPVAGATLVLWGLSQAAHPFLCSPDGPVVAWYAFVAPTTVVVGAGLLVAHAGWAQRRLVESEERFRLLAEHAQDLIYRYRLVPTRGFEYVSPSSTAMTGYTPQEHYADPDLGLKLVHPDDRHILEDVIRNPERLEEPVLLRWVRKGGGILWTEQCNVPVYGPDGTVIALEGVARDVTGRIEAMEALRQSERRYHSVFHRSHAVMLLVDPDGGRIVDANEAASRYYGYPRDRLLNMRLTDLSADPEREWRRAVGASGPSNRAHYESRHRLAGGELRDVEVYSGTVVIGEHEYLHQVVHDISARKRAEASLRETTEELHALLSASPLPVITLDVRGRVTLWNPAAESVFGWTEEEVLGRQLPIVAEHQMADFERLLARSMAGQSFSGLERTRYRKDGIPVRVSISTSPIRGADGEIVGIEALVADVTRQKLLEERYLQARKMEAIGRLAGGIAHDFNNLLTVINGTVELLTRDRDADDPLRADLQDVLEAGSRLAGLVRQLLAFGRRQIMDPQPLDLNAILEDMSGMLRRVLGEAVDLQLRLDDGLGIVRVDSDQIQQVIVDLAVNARDAMHRGGTLTLQTANAVVDDQSAGAHGEVRPGDYVVVTVSDTGPGLPPAVRSRLFEPFSAEDSGMGGGLGLASVYGIVKQLGGDIHVCSERGHGTTFRIYLPRVYARPAQPDVPGELETDRDHETILVVEDEPDVRSTTVRLARRLGYTVFEAPDGPSALELLRDAVMPIDLVITDIAMPGMSGVELARALRAEGHACAVLYITGYTGDAAEHGDMRDTDAPLAEKPLTLQSLARGIHVALGDGHSGGPLGHGSTRHRADDACAPPADGPRVDLLAVGEGEDPR